MPEPSPACIPYSPPGAHIYPKAFYSVREAAALLSYSVESIRDMIAAGHIAALAIRPNRRCRYRIPVTEIIRILTPLRPKGK